MPAVAYSCKMDIYTGISMTFIFVAVVGRMHSHSYKTSLISMPTNLISESVLVNYLSSRDDDSSRSSSVCCQSVSHKFGECFNVLSHFQSCRCCSPACFDICCRLAFPAAYVAFSVVYWGAVGVTLASGGTLETVKDFLED